MFITETLFLRILFNSLFLQIFCNRNHLRNTIMLEKCSKLRNIEMIKEILNEINILMCRLNVLKEK